VQLHAVTLPGGLGAHKWADRRLIRELSSNERTPLFVDLDGAVLEAAHAAVALAVDGTLLLPPLDGRILPSISRAELVADARDSGCDVRVERFTLADIRAGHALILTSSLRGPHPGDLDGTTRDPDRAATVWRCLLAGEARAPVGA
jgi:para-aminobenzoate synthetase/4-amino-4-deoxychorismate lyase